MLPSAASDAPDILQEKLFSQGNKDLHLALYERKAVAFLGITTPSDIFSFARELTGYSVIRDSENTS